MENTYLETLPIDIIGVIYEFDDTIQNKYNFCLKEINEINYAYNIYKKIYNNKMDFYNYVQLKINNKYYKNFKKNNYFLKINNLKK